MTASFYSISPLLRNLVTEWQSHLTTRGPVSKEHTSMSAYHIRAPSILARTTINSVLLSSPFFFFFHLPINTYHRLHPATTSRYREYHFVVSFHHHKVSTSLSHFQFSTLTMHSVVKGLVGLALINFNVASPMPRGQELSDFVALDRWSGPAECSKTIPTAFGLLHFGHELIDRDVTDL